MLERTSAFIVAMLATTLAARSAPADGAPAEITIGKPFPAIVLPDAQDGRPRSIADFRGKKVVLLIFASW